MVCRTVVCDSCFARQLECEALPADTKPIQRVEIAGGTAKDLCGPCRDAERKRLQESVFAGALVFRVRDPFKADAEAAPETTPDG